MLNRVRYFFSDVIYWVREHKSRSLGAVLLLVILVAGGVFAGTQLAGDDDRIDPGPAPEVFVGQGVVPEEPADLGFPAFATRNTTRVAGADSAANAAGVALATFPRGGVVKGPAAVTLVDDEDWAGGIAASSLVADPVGAPILMTTEGELGELTAGALESLDPTGSSATGGAQVFKVGDAGEAEGLDTRAIEGGNAAEIAVEVLELREKLVEDPPEHSSSPARTIPSPRCRRQHGQRVQATRSCSRRPTPCPRPRSRRSSA